MKIKCWKIGFIFSFGVLKIGAMEVPDRVNGSLPFPKLDLHSSSQYNPHSPYQEPSRYTNSPEYLGGSSSYPSVPISAFPTIPTDAGNVTSLSSQSNSETSVQMSYPSAPMWDPQEELQGEFKQQLQTNNFQMMVPYNQHPHAPLSIIPYDNAQQLSPQYVMMPEADYQRVMMCTSLLMNQNQEMKEMLQNLLLKGEEQTEVLVRVEQGQEILADELMTLKGALVKVTTELTDSRQSSVEKAYHWGKFLFNAGVSVATGATTYTLITPVLAFLPAVISPPLAVPMAIATLSGLKLFTKLV